MTSYDDIIDLALISVEDYRLNKLANYISEDNYDLLVASSNYDNYVSDCGNNIPVLIPVSEQEYDVIKKDNYNNYEDYVESSLHEFLLIWDGFMIRGLAKFNNCKKDLSDRNDNNREFNFILTDLEKSIIADYTVLMWLDKEINDVRQITAMMQNKNEAHRYSESNLLKEKRNRSIQINEDADRKKTEYSLLNTPWKEWANGNYEL